MKKNLVTYLVKRYLRFDKSQPFITVSAIFAFLGVSIGLMVLIIAMAIMNGTSKEFQKKLFVMNYPITIVPKVTKGVDTFDLQVLQKKFPNLIMSPYISSQVIIKKGDQMEGGILFGVDFEKEVKINEILAKATKDKKIKDFELIVGEGIKNSFFLEEEPRVTLIFTQNQPGGFTLIPTMKRFKYVGDFSSGLHAYDKAYMYTTLDSLSKVLKIKDNKYDGIHIYSDNPFEDIKKIREFLPSYLSAVGWWQLNGNLVAAMEMEKKALFIVLMLIILVASLNIVSSLMMTVMNRRKEIALLLSLGASKKEIKKTFFYLGSTIGGAGIIFGIFLGFFGMFLLSQFDIISLPADVYGTTKLPLDLLVSDFIAIVIGAVAIVAISSFYPAKKATQVDVLSTLRNE